MNNYSEMQEQTKETFSYKWGKIETYQSNRMMNDARTWLLKKYFDNDETKLNSIFSEGKSVLDAGCGASMSAIAMLGNKLEKLEYIGVDISDAILEAEMNFKKRGWGGKTIDSYSAI